MSAPQPQLRLALGMLIADRAWPLAPAQRRVLTELLGDPAEEVTPWLPMILAWARKQRPVLVPFLEQVVRELAHETAPPRPATGTVQGDLWGRTTWGPDPLPDWLQRATRPSVGRRRHDADRTDHLDHL